MIKKTSILFIVLIACVFIGPAGGDESNSQITELISEAQQADVGAQLLLGFMYADGQGVQKDLRKAIHWYTQAAEQDDPDAQFMLMVMYAEGQGIKPDYQKAYQWLLRAEANGKDVSAYRTELMRKISGIHLSEPQTLIKREIKNSGNTIPVMNLEAEPSIYVLEAEGFSALFPAVPQRMVVKDSNEIYVVHYQSLVQDQLVQYNVIFQDFKRNGIYGNESETQFFHDYLAGRAMVARNHKVQKKNMRFHGYPAVFFKHSTFFEGMHRIHEGITFLTEGNSITLTCVYHPSIQPLLSFSDFSRSFAWNFKETAEPY